MAVRQALPLTITLASCTLSAPSAPEPPVAAVAHSTPTPTPIPTPVDFHWRILIFGDAGTGGPGQKATARAMAERHELAPFHFAVTLGDNNRESSGKSPSSPVALFEVPYAPLIRSGLPMYATLGERDQGAQFADWMKSAQKNAAIASEEPAGFLLPGANYVIQRTGLKWVVLDVTSASQGNSMSPETRAFAEREICAHTERWMVVSAHFPLWSTGIQGDNKDMIRFFQPLLEKCPVDFFFSAHDTHAEIFEEEPTTFALIGNTALTRWMWRKSAKRSLVRFDELGFAELELGPEAGYLRFLNRQGEVVHTHPRQARGN